MRNIVHNPVMKKFTVIAYILPDGGHYVETVEAADATTAALQIREKLELKREEFEIVAIIAGEPEFAHYDHTKLNLAPYSSASP